MKYIIKLILNKLGYKIIKKKYMGSGIDLLHDISIDRNIEDINIIFDVGANIGQTAKKFTNSFPKSTIYSFEPIYSSYIELKKNLSFANNIKFFQLGFSDKKSKVEVYHQSDSGLNSIKKEINKPGMNNPDSSEMVDIDTIENFCKKNKIKQIDLLKIDAEGMDLKVLYGTKSLITSSKIKYILVETGFGKGNIRNTSFESVYEFLINYNYKLRGLYDQSNWGGVPYLVSTNALFLLQAKQ